MPSAKEIKDELRALRKEHQKPVSRMSKRDCADEVERLKHLRETTPNVAAVPALPHSQRKQETSTAPTLKEHQEHPLTVPFAEKMKAAKAAKKAAVASGPKPEGLKEVKAKMPKKVGGAEPSKEQMMKMLQKMMAEE
jgi:hypothetical protein